VAMAGAEIGSRWKKIERNARGEAYHVEPPGIGDTFEITVLEPFPGAATSGRQFPALYVLDGWVTLDIVAGTKRLYDIFSGGDIPPTYIVGISYADPDVGARRFRDFTPTEAALPAGLVHSTAHGLGGAPSFLEFLCGEIIPALEARYSLAPAERSLLGYSLSGLFAAYVLFHRPEIFSRYLIISPSLWWDEASILKDEAAWAASHTDLGAKVLLIGGESEEEPGGGWRNNLPDDVGLPLKQVSRLRELTQKLNSRGYPGLQLRTSVIPAGRHITVFPAAVGLGLADLFKL
jgi:predicted alpha/beta superfamily hydrolase